MFDGAADIVRFQADPRCHRMAASFLSHWLIGRERAWIYSCWREPESDADPDAVRDERLFAEVIQHRCDMLQMLGQRRGVELGTAGEWQIVDLYERGRDEARWKARAPVSISRTTQPKAKISAR